MNEEEEEEERATQLPCDFGASVLHAASRMAHKAKRLIACKKKKKGHPVTSLCWHRGEAEVWPLIIHKLALAKCG